MSRSHPNITTRDPGLIRSYMFRYVHHELMCSWDYDNHCDSFQDENGRFLRLELWLDLTILIYLFSLIDYIDTSQRNAAQRIVCLPKDWSWLTKLRRLDLRRRALFINDADRSDTIIMTTSSYDRKKMLVLNVKHSIKKWSIIFTTSTTYLKIWWNVFRDSRNVVYKFM